MSQTIANAASSPSAPQLTPRRGRWRASIEGSPGRLRLVAALSALAALAFALLGGGGYWMWSNAMQSAHDNAAQLVNVQTIQNALMRAHAAASTSYLAGGVAGTENVDAYRTSLKEATDLLPRVAAANAEDADAVAVLTAATTRYTDQMARAAELNEQQLNVGRAYLNSGGKILREEIAPVLEQLSALERRRVGDNYDAANRATGVLVAGAVLAVAAGGAAQIWLSRRTHRYLNIPAAVGTAAIVLSTGVGLVVLSRSASNATNAASHSYTATAALAEARTKAFDAKANEALGLINRGNYPASEKVVASDLAMAGAALDKAAAAGTNQAAVQALQSWRTLHDKVTAADADNRWAAAKDLVVASGAGSANYTFDSFDTASKELLESQAATTASSLGDAAKGLPWLGGLSVLVGLLAAVGAWAGFAQRWEEYL